MVYDVAVVGGGLAGLTSAAYLAKYGYKVVLCEKQDKTGGLVNSFSYKGFVLDGGIRAIENSGIVFPMLRQLGLDVPFYENRVSLIVGNEKLTMENEDFLTEYTQFLNKLFPNDKSSVEKLVDDVDQAMKHMHILYGFDNPLFVDLKQDVNYALSLIPWMFKYIFTIGKIDNLSEPIEEYLAHYVKNPVLIDMFAQHFFKKTPAFFALSYFSLYLDYNYPAGGTGVLAQKIEEYIKSNGGEVRLNCGIQSLDCDKKYITDTSGNEIHYKKLIWAADTKQLYSKLDVLGIKDAKLQKNLKQYQEYVQPKTGSDSIFTVYLLLDTPVENIKKYISSHVFYTPKMIGLSDESLKAKFNKAFKNKKIAGTQKDVLNWAGLYLELNTFEISCPALRDKQLAPEGKSALIISCLFDFWIIKEIENMGFYDEFKLYCEDTISEIILNNLMPELEQDKLEIFSSTPLTIQKLTENTDGSVTGWSFENPSVPSVTKMSKVASTIKTQIPDVYQAGQWTFAPSGLPIAVLTGKLAADKINKELGKKP